MEKTQAAFVDTETIAQKQAADGVVKDAIANFQTIAIRNPSLQSSELFVNLQYEMRGTENRIATERMRYNQAVQRYNQSFQAFPTVLVVNVLNFEQQSFFESTQ